MIESLKEQLVLLAKRLHDKNYLAAADGNISYRINDDMILFTPSGQNKYFIQPKDIAIITLDNQIISGHPSSERLMHLAVYQTCPQAKAVVHAHPPFSIAWSLLQENYTELPREYLSELILATTKIPIVPYARPGTADMGEQLKPYLPTLRNFILKRHGALSWGEDLFEAYNGIERIEHTAYILSVAKQMGPLSPLDKEEVQTLQALRQQLGPKTL